MQENYPKTPKEAYLTRSVFYFTGAPCPRGHIALRYESSNRCVECCKENVQKLTPEKRKSYKVSPTTIARQKASRKKRASRPLQKFINSARNLIARSFQRKGSKKPGRTEALLGCTIAEFRIHIERQFLRGMTWENRSDWHIDHITPIATAKTIGEITALCHFTNLRPLWKEDNIKKSDNITHLL